MKILVTGAKGFVGKNLCAALKNIKDGKDKTRPSLLVEEIFEYDIDSSLEDLDLYCEKADFVFNLAGVNRPQTQEEFMQGNFGFASTLLQKLKDNNTRIIYHNGKFDIRVCFNTMGVYLPIWWDTMIAAQLLNENELAKLKYQYKVHVRLNQFQERFGILLNKLFYLLNLSFFAFYLLRALA